MSDIIEYTPITKTHETLEQKFLIKLKEFLKSEYNMESYDVNNGHYDSTESMKLKLGKTTINFRMSIDK